MLDLVLKVILPPAIPDDTNTSDTVKPVFYGVDNFVLDVSDDAFNAKTGITAIDNIDGDITSKIIIASNTVSLGVEGTYKVIYSVSDNAGNTSTATRNVYVIKKVKEYAYTGGEQTFTALFTGKYKLEVWGAQGGGNGSGTGGYGGYSSGYINLNKNQIVYINVGGVGIACTYGAGSCKSSGGYNGGGYAYSSDQYTSGGGGATHIALSTGLLSTLSSNVSSIIIVAGGGGGGGYYSTGYGYGGSGGG